MAKMHTVGGSWDGIMGGASGVSCASDRKNYGVPESGVFVMPEPNAWQPVRLE